MVSVFTVGIGAGLAAALLFAVVVTGSPAGVILSYVAPLPVIIAALGWNHRSGLVAALVGAVATSLAFRLQAGLAFTLGSALPGWWLAYLALLGRSDAGGTITWYPLGRLLLWVAGTATLVTLFGILALGRGDFEAYRSTLQQAVEGVLQVRPPARPAPEGALTAPAVVEGLVSLVPFLAAAIFTLVLVLNLWLAGKAVAISDRLPRPWPFIPATRMPRLALGLVVGAIVATLLPGFVGAAGLALAGALTMAFALQGFAFLHDTSQGRTGRPALLGFAYLLAVLVGHTVLPLLAIAGAADTAFDLRHRFRSGQAGPPPRT